METTTTHITHPDGTQISVVTESSASAGGPPPAKDARERMLITGGAGFIGSHTVVELLGAGYAVTCAAPRCPPPPPRRHPPPPSPRPSAALEAAP